MNYANSYQLVSLICNKKYYMSLIFGHKIDM